MRWRTHEPEQAQGIISDVFAPHELTVDGRGAFAFDFDLLDSPHLTVGYSRFGSDVVIDVPPPSTFYCLCLTPEGTVGTRSGEHAITVSPDTASVLSPGEGWGFVDWTDTLISVRMGRAELEDDLAALIGRRVEDPIRFDGALDLRRGSGRDFGELVRILQTAPSQMHPVMADRLGALLRSAMLVSFAHNYSDLLHDDGGSRRMPASIARVVDAIEHDPMQVRTAADAARLAHLSLRALEKGFARDVGVSPMAYVRQVRLARARADLQTADPEVDTVTSVALRWGFGHAGRFATLYRERYGEPPSSTLRNLSRP